MNTDWTRFHDSLHEGLPVPSVILESWQRCESFGLLTGKAAVPFVGADEAARRVARNAELIEVAGAHLRWLSAAVAGLPFHTVMLTDADGVIVDSAGNRPDVMDQFGLRAGYDWSERGMGTNGIGTALATRRPVAVVGDAHFLSVIHNYTCVGAPIVSEQGELLGAIDLCVTAADGDPSRLVLVAYAAKTIAEELGRRHQSTSSAKDQVAFVAHELATPLSTLALLSHRLLQVAEAGSATQAVAQRFDHQLQRLCTLLDGLVDGAAGRPVLDGIPKPEVDLGVLVQEVAEEFDELAARTGRVIELHCDVPIVDSWDAGKWQQVITNLVSNAYKYGERGPIRIDVDDLGEAARVVVGDRGPGVPVHERAAIFQSRVRGSNAVTRKGAGLGLWIVRDLVRSLGGTVELDETRTEGAAFVVTVPKPTAARREEVAS